LEGAGSIANVDIHAVRVQRSAESLDQGERAKSWPVHFLLAPETHSSNAKVSAVEALARARYG
jgi:hypothetical protein